MTPRDQRRPRTFHVTPAAGGWHVTDAGLIRSTHADVRGAVAAARTLARWYGAEVVVDDGSST